MFTPPIIALGLCGVCLAAAPPASRPASHPALLAARPVIRKLGAIDCDLVETTPIVFRKRLYRVESVREQYTRKAADESGSYLRLVDVATGTPTSPFGRGHHLCSAYVEGDTVFVFAVDKCGATRVDGYASTDLKNWRTFKALDLPGWSIFNNSVCKGEERYVMALEIDAPREECGVPFTIRFAESRDLEHWTLTPPACVYAKDRYTSCPTLRFLEGRYYLMYCEALPGPTYLTYLLRSKDLVHWESSPLAPVMNISSEDHQVSPGAKGLKPEERARIASGVNVCNTDIDLCEFEGKVVLYYCWGNQTGIEFLAEARYDGTLSEFLTGFFSSPATQPAAGQSCPATAAPE